jgi:hypothetical protein
MPWSDLWGRAKVVGIRGYNVAVLSMLSAKKLSKLLLNKPANNINNNCHKN